MPTRRILLILFTCGAVTAWGFLFSRLYARHQRRGLLDLEPRITATGEAVFDDDWFGLYFEDGKVGWHHYVLEEGDPRVGQRFRVQSESRLVFSILGTAYPMVLQNTCAMDEELAPVRFKTTLVTPLQRVTVQGKRTESGIGLVLQSGKISRTAEIQVPGDSAPLVLQETLPARLVADGIAPGKELTYTLFDPVLQLLAPLRIRILAEEDIRIAGKTTKAYPLEMDFQGIRMRWWLAEDGTTLRGESFLGGQRFREEKESPTDAVAGVGGAPVDLIAKTRIQPEGKIPDEGFVSRLHVRLSGLDAEAFPSLGGKVIRRGPNEVELLLEEGPSSLERPLSEEERTRYLESTLSITADDPQVLELAKGLLGVKSPAPPARRIWDWVRANVRREFVIGYPTAAEVLETRRGDCNEHTALVAALCRAASIPCKAVAGIVHLNDSFYYHAWNEIYMEAEDGSAGWLPVDAAFGQWPADATHIRIVEGDPAEQAAIMALFGNLEIAILPVGGTPL